MRWIQDPLLPKCSQIYQNCPIFPKKRLTNPEIAEENPGLLGIVWDYSGIVKSFGRTELNVPDGLVDRGLGG